MYIEHANHDYNELVKIYIKNRDLPIEERFCEPSVYEVSLYKWLKTIILEDKGFNIVTSKGLRELVTTYKHFSVTTIMKYIVLIQDEVTVIIAGILPDKIGLIIDGWSDGLRNHYLGVFASFIDSNGEKKTILLAMSPLNDETNETAQNHVNTIVNLLKHSYNKEITSVVYITADNANVNKAIADLLNQGLNENNDKNKKSGKYTKFIGCYAHAFNLYCKNILFKEYEELIELVSTLVSKFKQSNNNNGQLLLFTKLRLMQLNVTRWSSVYNMLVRLIFSYDIIIFTL